ncbi:MAG: S1 RNA-binding domain-containing protein [Bacilli bacterium]|jgi:predicted RNA-binding protein with RPS1 domain|nr:S1 RNA-binding domain-containing protein [Bacilli bacterium]
MSQMGDILVGTVVRVYPKYAIMLFDEGETGLLHISELSNDYVRNFAGFVHVGNIYKVKVIEMDAAKGFMKVSLKRVSEQERREGFPKKRIDPSLIDFAELERRLPEWIEEENGKED